MNTVWLKNTEGRTVGKLLKRCLVGVPEQSINLMLAHFWWGAECRQDERISL